MVFVLCMMPSFKNSENRKWRGLIFICLGLSAGYPAMTIMFNHVPEEMLDASAMMYAIGGAIYIGGALLFIT